MYEIGNDYYSIQFGQTQFQKTNVYGLKYNFYLEDGVGEKLIISDSDCQINYVPEYLVETRNLFSLARRYGLDVQERENFISFYQKNKDE